MMMSTSADRSDDAKYRGVRKRKWGKWVSEIRLPNSRERIWLGSYDSPEKAARAFDAALFCLRGNTANFNFPDQAPDIPGGTDLHPSQIQAVAAHFANSYTASTSASASHQDPTISINVNNNNNSIESSSFIHMEDSNSSIPDYGIFPGFDDYFMPTHEPPYSLAVDYREDQQVYDGVYSHDPCFLWNF